MLSAVAARKAAEAARQDLRTLVDPEIVAPPPMPPSASTPPLKTISKRKPSAQVQNPSRKAKKKKTGHEKARYFAPEDSFVKQDDVIAIDEDNYQPSDIEDDEMELGGPPSLDSIIPSTKGTQASSPSHSLQDSSDEEMDHGEDEPCIHDTPTTTAPPKAAVEERPMSAMLSTFEPRWNSNIFVLSSAETEFLEPSTFVTDLAVALVMMPDDTLSLLGTYALTVIHGSISLAGVTLLPSQRTHSIFAPRCSPIPALRCLQSNAKTLSSIPTTLAERLHLSLKQDCSIVVLRALSTGVDGLGRVCRVFDGVFEPSRWHRNANVPDLGLTGVHMLTHQHRDIQPFVLPSSWDMALSAVCPEIMHNERNYIAAPIYFVKGPKKSGKSTFARILLNRLLTRYQKVAYLECDIGQSEFTPGGMVALNIIEQPLFGPPFTHPSIPHLAHYIGSATPRSSPSHYLNAIQALVHSYRLDIESPVDTADQAQDDPRIVDTIPLLVNNMGWNKGLGADLTRQIQDMVEPTDIFEVEAPTFERGWPVADPIAPNGTFGQQNMRLHVLEPITAPILTNNYSPADYRVLSMLSYFHAIFPPSRPKELQQISASSWNTELPLCARPPYEVDWTQALDRVFLVGAGMEDVIPSEIERVLNGAIVGLVSCASEAIDIDIESSLSNQAIPYTQGALPISPSTSTCHGLALIRSVSPDSTHMHVLTSLPAFVLAKCRVMVKGELELPVWGMLDFRSNGGEGVGTIAGVEKSKVPYLQWGKGEGIGGERRRVRRNLMRKGQM